MYTLTELHYWLVCANRYEEEVAPFQAEKSLTVETSEASPWTYLQKTYSNVEESTVSTAGQQHTCRKGRTTIDQEEVTIAHHTTASMQVSDTWHLGVCSLFPLKISSCLQLVCMHELLASQFKIAVALSVRAGCALATIASVAGL